MLKLSTLKNKAYLLVLVTHSFVSDGSSTIIYILYNYYLKS